MPSPQARVARAMRGLTVGAVKNLRETERLADEAGLGEFRERFTIEVMGQTSEKSQVATVGLAVSDALRPRLEGAKVRPHLTASVFIDGRFGDEPLVNKKTGARFRVVPVPLFVFFQHAEPSFDEHRVNVTLYLAPTAKKTPFAGLVQVTAQGYGCRASGVDPYEREENAA